ncbi:MAG TPA: NUDIX domain-containing protein [Bradyrhizobium sp.]|jgi:predicted NUDIX family NTP pyrophosphohydrolase|nr:NUDIX domain-containing protein [Bradyrhizobium sp.]
MDATYRRKVHIYQRRFPDSDVPRHRTSFGSAARPSGGPFWRNKDDGAWSIPKGEIAGEDPESVARREFMEELGSAPAGPLRLLGEIRQRGGKRVHSFALQGDLDVSTVVSNTFEMEWPPKSGRTRTFPEVDRAEWFALPVACMKILEGQRALLDRLEELIRR